MCIAAAAWATPVFSLANRRIGVPSPNTPPVVPRITKPHQICRSGTVFTCYKRAHNVFRAKQRSGSRRRSFVVLAALSDSSLRSLFDELDIKHTGTIDAYEIQAVLRSLGREVR